MRPVYLVSKTPYEGVIHLPVLTIRFLHPKIDFTRYDGLIFTSKQGIEALSDYPDTWKTLECVCVSDPTARYAKAKGAVRVHPAQGYGSDIPEVLKRFDPAFRWLYLRPESVASEWAETARSQGHAIDEIIVYETGCNGQYEPPKLEDDAVLIFTSPSAVNCFLERSALSSGHTLIAIGTTTHKAFPKGYDAHVSEETSLASAVELAKQLAER